MPLKLDESDIARLRHVRAVIDDIAQKGDEDSTVHDELTRIAREIDMIVTPPAPPVPFRV